MVAEKEKTDEMSFLGHLEELRWHFIRAFLSVFVFAVVAFIFHEFIFDVIILAPKKPDFFTNYKMCEFSNFMGMGKNLCINSKPLNLINIKMAGQFSTHIMVSFIMGIIVAFPYIFWEFWRFIRPALYANERKYARGAVFFSSLLFALGVLFGYYLIIPLSVHFLSSYSVSNEIANTISLGSYISTVTSVTLASGIIFELPIFVFFLSRTGLVTVEGLKKYRRHSIIVILLLSAIITPPDIFSQLLVSMPLFFLYEAGIIIARRIEIKQKIRTKGDKE